MIPSDFIAPNGPNGTSLWTHRELPCRWLSFKDQIGRWCRWSVFIFREDKHLSPCARWDMGSFHLGGCNDFWSFGLIDELCMSHEVWWLTPCLCFRLLLSDARYFEWLIQTLYWLIMPRTNGVYKSKRKRIINIPRYNCTINVNAPWPFEAWS